jgi:hypothetical protein
MFMPRNEHSFFSGNIIAANIASDAVTTVKILDANVTIPKEEAALTTGQINIALSLAAAAELGTFKVYFPMKVTINKIRTAVTKVVGSTSDATVTGANVSGNSDDGQVTIAASAAIGELDSASPTSNNVVAANGWYSLTTYKANNYAGMIEVSLEYTRTA